MNLTSKRLLQFFAGCVGVCAFTAAAGTQYLVDTFDEDNVIYYTDGGPTVAASNRMDIAHYKSTLYSGDLTFFTNSWFAATGDASALTNVTPNISDLSKKPLAGGTLGTYVLNLETEGQTLTRGVDAQPDILAGDVYVDSLIKFTPSEDAPTIANDVKAAVYVNVSSNLVIHHGATDYNPAGEFETSVAINPSQWYRLTIQLHKLGDNTSVFKVYLDNVYISSTEYAVDDDFNKGGSWFYTANQDSDTLMKAVAFQGTGMIDELVVADEVNALTPPTGVQLTLSIGTGIASVYDDTASASVSDGGIIASGHTITITAADWYEITGVTGTGVTYGDSASLGAGTFKQTSSGTLSGTEAATVTIAAAQFSGSITTGLAAPYDTLSGSAVAAWGANKSGKTQAEVQTNLGTGGSWLGDYLMNVPAETGAKPIINSIMVDSGVATITVGATSGAVDFTNLNGTLKVYTADTLGGTFSLAGSYTIPSTTQHSVTFEITMGTAKFIKAVVE